MMPRNAYGTSADDTTATRIWLAFGDQNGTLPTVLAIKLAITGATVGTTRWSSRALGGGQIGEKYQIGQLLSRPGELARAPSPAVRRRIALQINSLGLPLATIS